MLCSSHRILSCGSKTSKFQGYPSQLASESVSSLVATSTQLHLNTKFRMTSACYVSTLKSTGNTALAYLCSFTSYDTYFTFPPDAQNTFLLLCLCPSASICPPYLLHSYPSLMSKAVLSFKDYLTLSHV